MTTPTTQGVIHRLVELSRLLDEATEEIAQLDETAVRLKSKYEVEYARAFLNSEGAMDVRKQETVYKVAAVRLDYEIAEQQVRACKERLRTLRDQLEIGRSLSAAIRSEWAASGVGQP